MAKYGVFIEQAPLDWQILQHINGAALVKLSGTWVLNRIDGMELMSAPCVKVRIMQEDDNFPVIPWTLANTQIDNNVDSGYWSCDLSLPIGGLYRIETALYTDFGVEKRWLERGDVRLHIGVGNVFVIAGQSNAAGVGRDSAYDPPSLGVHLFRNCMRWDMAAHPINESTYTDNELDVENGITGTSPYLSFGRLFKKISKGPVGLIITALGGSGIDSWVKDIDGELYRNMIKRIKLCGGEIAGVLWYQGCRDTCSIENAEGYLAKFTQMTNDFRNDLAQDVPFFTFQLNASPNNPNSAQWPIVKEAQRQAAEQIQNVYIMPTSDCATSDHIHNRSGANVALGERLARQCANILCGSVAWNAPNITSARLYDNTVHLEFANNRLGFEYFNHNPGTGFTVEDNNSIIEIASWSFEPKKIMLQLAEKPNGDVYVSFEANCSPSKNPVCDAETYLPIISFNRFCVTNS